MKIAGVFLLLGVLISCGKSGGGSTDNQMCATAEEVGNWDHAFAPVGSPRLVVRTNCTGRIVECNSDFTFTPKRTDGKYDVHILNGGGTGCMTVGTHICESTLSSYQTQTGQFNNVQISCDNSAYGLFLGRM